MMIDRKLLFIGCGHSGTFYISEVFQNLDIDIRHELVGKDGVAGWNFTHLLEPALRESGLENPIVFHQIRHHLNVISSVQDMDDDTWREIGGRAKHNGIDWNPLDDPHPIRGMRYWLMWNTFAERISNYQYRIEDLENVWPVIMRILQRENCPVPFVKKTINKHEYDHVFTWDELEASDRNLSDKVKEMSEKYGYDTK